MAPPYSGSAARRGRLRSAGVPQRSEDGRGGAMYTSQRSQDERPIGHSGVDGTVPASPVSLPRPVPVWKGER